MVWGLALCHQSQAHSQAPYYVGLVHKDRLRVWVDDHHRSIVRPLAQGSLLVDAPREEMVDMGHCSKRRGGPRGRGHSLAGNCDLVPVGSHVRSPRCVRKNC
jgi:hypothetical protein